MSNIIIKFLLAGDKFMPGIHLRQHGFMYSTCVSFTKKKKRKKEYKNLKQQETLNIFQNKLDKACFQHISLMEISKI